MGRCGPMWADQSAPFPYRFRSEAVRPLILDSQKWIFSYYSCVRRRWSDCHVPSMSRVDPSLYNRHIIPPKTDGFVRAKSSGPMWAARRNCTEILRGPRSEGSLFKINRLQKLPKLLNAIESKTLLLLPCTIILKDVGTNSSIQQNSFFVKFCRRIDSCRHLVSGMCTKDVLKQAKLRRGSISYWQKR